MPATFPVLLLRSGLQVDVAPGQVILLAAEAGGASLPSSCRNGTCRTCMCRLARGQVSYRIAWPGLSSDEKREGWILPCVAYALSALEIEA
jgi:ferredoxin